MPEYRRAGHALVNTTEADVFDGDMLDAMQGIFGEGRKGAIIKMCNMLYASKSCPLKLA